MINEFNAIIQLIYIVVNGNDLVVLNSDVSVSSQMISGLRVSVYNVSACACLSRGISVIDLYEVSVLIQLQGDGLAVGIGGRIQEVYVTLVLVLNTGDSNGLDTSGKIFLTLSPSSV